MLSNQSDVPSAATLFNNASDPAGNLRAGNGSGLLGGSISINTGGGIGLTVSGVFLFLLALGLCYWCMRRRGYSRGESLLAGAAAGAAANSI